MTTTTPRILLLGGHGKVGLLMTPKILSRSWNLISMVRSADHKQDILAAADKAPKEGRGQLDVLVANIGDVKSEGDAKGILEKVKPDWVIWSAGRFALFFLLYRSLSSYAGFCFWKLID
jgi:hypothetical protein